MSSIADNVILTFPPRPVSRWERALLAEWLAAAQREGHDVHGAFVSERRSDDPMLFGRIVIVLWSSPDPAFLVHSPAGFAFWVVMAVSAWDQLRRLPTLCAALNSIRPVLDEPCSGTEEFFSNLPVDRHYLTGRHER
jgi:hypothetical protein